MYFPLGRDPECSMFSLKKRLLWKVFHSFTFHFVSFFFGIIRYITVDVVWLSNNGNTGILWIRNSQINVAATPLGLFQKKTKHLSSFWTSQRVTQNTRHHVITSVTRIFEWRTGMCLTCPSLSYVLNKYLKFYIVWQWRWPWLGTLIKDPNSSIPADFRLLTVHSRPANRWQIDNSKCRLVYL